MRRKEIDRGGDEWLGISEMKVRRKRARKNFTESQRLNYNDTSHKGRSLAFYADL